MNDRVPFGERIVTLVFIGLLALATTSLLLSSHHLGSGQLPVALGIAGIKAALITLVFIGVARARASMIIAVVLAVVMSCSMIGLILMDITTR
jgi:cytochrome c oxidase subunit 4